MELKVNYNGKTYIEKGDTFLYKVRKANMIEYELLTANEITVDKMDMKQLAHYRRNLRKGRFYTDPYKWNTRSKNDSGSDFSYGSLYLVSQSDGEWFNRIV